MAVKVAIASSDGNNIDLHFGKASEFLIYELKDGVFVQVEKRQLQSIAGEADAREETLSGGGCGSGSGGGFGCGGGSGCGGCGGGNAGPLAPAVELLLDCRAVVAAQIGQNMRRQFDRNAISVFDIELPVGEALEKLASYYIKFGEE